MLKVNVQQNRKELNRGGLDQECNLSVCCDRDIAIACLCEVVMSSDVHVCCRIMLVCLLLRSVRFVSVIARFGRRFA
jgi:hypothetical protein